MENMKSIVFDGRVFVKEKEEILKKKILKLGIKPKVVSVFFAEDPGSILYTNIKQKAAERVGIVFHPEEISLKTPLESILNIVRHYSNDESVDGVMIQKPKLESVSEVDEVGELGFVEWWRRLVDEIKLGKDVDCLNPVNLERVYRGSWKILPAVVRAIVSILEESGIDISDKKVVVVGKSELVGKPLAYVLAQKGARVFLCGSSGLAAKSVGPQLSFEIEPEDLSSVVGKAEILISAVGKPGLIKGQTVRKGVAVIDVGWPIGDVDFESVGEKASFITPVPGGVGPVTVLSLMENLVDLVS